MGRPLRVDHAGAWHDVMNRGTGHRTIFVQGEDCLPFLSVLENAATRYRLEVREICSGTRMSVPP